MAGRATVSFQPRRTGWAGQASPADRGPGMSALPGIGVELTAARDPRGGAIGSRSPRPSGGMAGGRVPHRERAQAARTGRTTGPTRTRPWPNREGRGPRRSCPGRSRRPSSSAAREAHAEAWLRAQGDVRRGSHALAGLHRQPEALGDRRQEQDGFHRGERVADALARPTAEGEVGKARQAAGEVAGPSLGAERLGVLEPAAVAMHHPRRHDHDDAARKGMAGHLGRSRRLSSDGIGRRVQAHGFVDDHLGVRQSRQVGHGGRVRAEHRAQLIAEPRVDLRVLGEEIPDPRQCHRGGLVPCHEEGHGLVADLLGGHPAAVVGVLRVQEDGEQVAAVLATLPASGDHAVDDLIEAADRPARSEVGRCRHPVGEELEHAPQSRAEVLDQDVQRLGDRVALVRDVGVEESLGDDDLGQRDHLGVGIEDVAVLPRRPAGARCTRSSPRRTQGRAADGTRAGRAAAGAARRRLRRAGVRCRAPARADGRRGS